MTVCLLARLGTAAALSVLATQGATALAAAGGAASATQAHAAGCLTVHVGPSVRPGEPASYFLVTGAGGSTSSESVLIANPEPYACRVELDAAYGKTATNSGDTYPFVPPGRCVRTSCWLSGLPGAVTVAARSRLAVPFQVRVPPGTAPGEYLAGVLVRPAAAAASRPHGAGVGAVVTTSVGIGVAVRVPGPLRPSITIASVTLALDGGTPLLHIVERNTGNSWEHPAGGALIAAAPHGRALRLGLSSSTLLPGDSATLTLPVVGATRGAHQTSISLWYANDTKKATWKGLLAYPGSTAPAARPRTGPSQVVITTSQTPTWVVALAAGLGVAVVALLLLLAITLRRRRQDGPGREQGIVYAAAPDRDPAEPPE